jgi:hypothetical protein
MRAGSMGVVDRSASGRRERATRTARFLRDKTRSLLINKEDKIEGDRDKGKGKKNGNRGKKTKGKRGNS